MNYLLLYCLIFVEILLSCEFRQEDCIVKLPIYPGMEYKELMSDTNSIVSQFHKVSLNEIYDYNKLYWIKYGFTFDSCEACIYAMPKMSFNDKEGIIGKVEYELEWSDIGYITPQEFPYRSSQSFQKLLPCIDDFADRFLKVVEVDTIQYLDYSIVIDKSDSLRFAITIE